MKKSNNKKTRDVTAFIYPRLSRDDNLEGESYSISNQKKLLTKMAKDMGYTNIVTFVDDGVSGVTMDRPGFNEMMRQLEEGKQFFAHKYPEMKYLAYFQAYTLVSHHALTVAARKRAA